MKVRVISSILALPLLFIALYFFPGWGLATVVSILSAVCTYELLYATRFVSENRAALFFCFAMAALIPIFTYFQTFLTGTVGLFVFVCFLFITGFFDLSYMTFERICGCFRRGRKAEK